MDRGTERGVSAATPGPSVVALRCPSCGRDLPSAAFDRAWTCAPCARAFEVDDGRLAERDVAVAVVDAERPRDAVHLPFWRFVVDVDVAGGSPAARTEVAAWTRNRPLWVRAFRQRGAFLAGDPGQALTQSGAEVRLRRGDLPAIVGARTTSREALVLAERFVLAAADRAADVTGVRVALHVRETCLVAVAYEPRGDSLVSTIDGGAIARRALPDFARQSWRTGA
jgi:hypothetical protein